MMNRIGLLIGGIASATAVVGLMLVVPASADPSDLNHQICASFDQKGLNVRSLMDVEVQLIKAHVSPGIAVRQAVATDCPKYESDLAEAVRQAGVENQHINGNY
jgi:hypothetical protein